LFMPVDINLEQVVGFLNFYVCSGTTSTVISEGLEKNCKFPRGFYRKQ
jgi:hypothetical protein